MIVGIDVGLKRIGVAVALSRNLVVPSEPIIRKNRNQAAKDVADMLRQKGARTLVVGIPKGGSNEEEMKRRIEYFVNLIQFNGEIYYVDEAYSSVEASEICKDYRDGRFDSIAASIILRRYLGV